MKTRRPTHILVVDDERELCLLYGMVLSNHGYELTEAHSGAEAVELLDTLVPDIVVTDFRMPNGNGLSVIEKAQTKHIPVILVSGFSENLSAAELHNVTILHKPINFAELMNAVDSTIASAKSKSAS